MYPSEITSIYDAVDLKLLNCCSFDTDLGISLSQLSYSIPTNKEVQTIERHTFLNIVT
jgi:hypothetical protein